MQKIRTLLFSFSRLPNPQIHACSFVKRKEQSKEFASWEQKQKKKRERERSEKNVFSKGTTRSLKEKRKENEKKHRTTTKPEEQRTKRMQGTFFEK